MILFIITSAFPFLSFSNHFFILFNLHFSYVFVSLYSLLRLSSLHSLPSFNPFPFYISFKIMYVCLSPYTLFLILISLVFAFLSYTFCISCLFHLSIPFKFLAYSFSSPSSTLSDSILDNSFLSLSAAPPDVSPPSPHILSSLSLFTSLPFTSLFPPASSCSPFVPYFIFASFPHRYCLFSFTSVPHPP